jgi:predicted alpha/beta-hydrolase family hydrolase
MRVPGVEPMVFEPHGAAVGTAVLVPGRGYSPHAPLLFFTGLALAQHGWRAEQHWWDPPRRESERTTGWVRGEVEPALPSSGRALVVGKSLGTLAASLAAERRLPAIWLTPVLGMAEVVEAIAANDAPQLLVGGSADELWDSRVARDLAGPTCTVVEIPGADHGLLMPGDVIRGAEAHVQVVRAVDDWMSSGVVPAS